MKHDGRDRYPFFVALTEEAFGIVNLNRCFVLETAGFFSGSHAKYPAKQLRIRCRLALRSSNVNALLNWGKVAPFFKA